MLVLGFVPLCAGFRRTYHFVNVSRRGCLHFHLCVSLCSPHTLDRVAAVFALLVFSLFYFVYWSLNLLLIMFHQVVIVCESWSLLRWKSRRRFIRLPFLRKECCSINSNSNSTRIRCLPLRTYQRWDSNTFIRIVFVFVFVFVKNSRIRIPVSRIRIRIRIIKINRIRIRIRIRIRLFRSTLNRICCTKVKWSCLCRLVQPWLITCWCRCCDYKCIYFAADWVPKQ